MKRVIFAALLGISTAPALAADVGVSISIGQPGFYGQIDIGNFPQPPVVFARPVVIAPSPKYVAVEPIYLHVPPGHERHWSRHCARYHACGRPVYFVRDDWYNNEYVPRYARHDHGDEHRGHGRGNGHHKDHDHGDGDGHRHED